MRRSDGLRSHVAIIAAASLLAIAVAVVATIALTSGGTAPAPGGAAAEPPPAAELPALAVFQQAATQDDVIPDGALGPGSERFGADASGSRLAFSQEGRDVWVVPGADGAVCLGSTDHGVSGCVTDPALAQQPGVSVVVCSPFVADDRLLLYGVVPDHMRDLVLQHEDGSATRVPTEGNVFVADVPRKRPLPLQISWTDAPTGEVRTATTAVPRDAAEERCDTSISPAEAERRLAQQQR